MKNLARTSPALYLSIALLSGCLTSPGSDQTGQPDNPGEPESPSEVIDVQSVTFNGTLPLGVCNPFIPLRCVTDDSSSAFLVIQGADVDRWELNVTIEITEPNFQGLRLFVEAAPYTTVGGPCAMLQPVTHSAGNSPLTFRPEIHGQERQEGLCIRVIASAAEAQEQPLGVQPGAQFRMTGTVTSYVA